MNNYEDFYEIGEEYFLGLLKTPDRCRSNINGLSNTVIFNENDHYSSHEGIIHFYLTDEKDYTFTVLINLLRNRFTLMYWNEKDEDLFVVKHLPYDISEEWHFQLSTKNYPVSYEFLIHLKNYVKFFEDIMMVNHCIDVLRELNDIVPYPNK